MSWCFQPGKPGWGGAGWRWGVGVQQGTGFVALLAGRETAGETRLNPCLGVLAEGTDVPGPCSLVSLNPEP